MTPHRHWLRNYKPFCIPIRLADNSIVYSEGVGSVVFNPTLGAKQACPVEFTSVLYVPQLRSNLLSVLFLTKQRNFQVQITSDSIAFNLHGITRFIASIDSHSVASLNGTTLASPSHSADFASTPILPIPASSPSVHFNSTPFTSHSASFKQ